MNKLVKKINKFVCASIIIATLLFCIVGCGVTDYSSHSSTERIDKHAIETTTYNELKLENQITSEGTLEKESATQKETSAQIITTVNVTTTQAETTTEKETTTKDETTTEQQITTEQTTTLREELVWVPKTGKKYHRSEDCSNMKNPRQVTISEAEDEGYTPCKKCYD